MHCSLRLDERGKLMTWRVVLASILGAVVFMAWGFAFWAGGLAPKDLFKSAPDEPTAMAALAASFPESGVYVLPSPTKGMADPDFVARHAAGPIAQVFIQREGSAVNDPQLYALGFLHDVVSAFLLALVLAGVSSGLPGFGQRWFALVLVALFAVVAQEGADIIWWGHDAAYHVWIAGYAVAGWALAALPIAALVHARRRL